jgi:hypothetical protein
MIAPIVPGTDAVAAALSGKTDYVLIDRMDYHYADWVYRQHHLLGAMSDWYFRSQDRRLASSFEEERMKCPWVS